QHLCLALRRAPGMGGARWNDDRLSGARLLTVAIDLDPDLALFDQDDFLLVVKVAGNRDAGLDPVAQHTDALRAVLGAREPSTGHAGAHQDLRQGIAIDDR